MKLTYRGQVYEMSAPVQPASSSADQSKTKLIYRGHMYYTTLRSVVVPEAVEPDASKVTLIYRGNTYERKLQSPKSYQQSRAINWRYQIGQ